MIHHDVLGTVGHTPMVELSKLARGLPARIAVKLESRNPCSSIKDRIGLAMIEAAEQQGALTAGMTLIEPTSGNTGIALAYVAASRGYKLRLVMPETMSRERIALLLYLGADVVLTPGSLMQAAVERARQLVTQTPGSIMFDQFSNPANPDVHRRTTGPEIWKDTDGDVDIFVAGVGTGGTITGVGEFLRSRKENVRLVAVEPEKAAVLSGRRPGNHLLQGIGAGFIPKVLNREIIDQVMTVTEDDAFTVARRLAREEGILGGMSSGAAVWAALQLAKRPENEGKLIITTVCDSGERYVSTPLAPELVRAR